MSDPLELFPTFVEAVARRLKDGRRAYGDRSFSRPPAELLSELAQETLDLAGWGFVLWFRIQALRSVAQRRDAKRGTEPRAVRVIPIITYPDGRGAQPHAEVELARVPACGEYVLLAHGAFCVTGVSFFANSTTAAAEIFLRPMPDPATAAPTQHTM